MKSYVGDKQVVEPILKRGHKRRAVIANYTNCTNQIQLKVISNYVYCTCTSQTQLKEFFFYLPYRMYVPLIALNYYWKLVFLFIENITFSYVASANLYSNYLSINILVMLNIIVIYKSNQLEKKRILCGSLHSTCGQHHNIYFIFLCFILLHNICLFRQCFINK